MLPCIWFRRDKQHTKNMHKSKKKFVFFKGLLTKTIFSQR
eukprot:UN06225